MPHSYAMGIHMKKILKGSKKYYRKILVLMLLLIICATLPFAVLLYNKSAKNIKNGINNSNYNILKQIKYNYNYFSSTMSALCMSTFMRYDVRELMYNEDLDYVTIYQTIREMNDNIIRAQPSLQSITVYNSSDKQWYSTQSANDNPGDSITGYLKENGSVQKLKPVLRKIDIGTDQISAISYVFSYFMYEYQDPVSGQGSYLVFNQTADEFINNLNGEIAGDYPISLYIANRNGDVYGNNRINSQSLEKIVEDCVIRHSRGIIDAEQSYVETYNSEKYYISYVDLGDNTNYIVMIQRYNDLFRGVIQIQSDFILIGVFFVLLTLVAVVLTSKRIYNPVNELVQEVSGMTEGSDADVSKRQDEIHQLRQAFIRTNMLYKKLQEEKNSSFRIVDNYRLLDLLSHSSEIKWERYLALSQDSVFHSLSFYKIGIVIVSLDYFKDNKFFFQDADRELLTESAINVLKEVLEPMFCSVDVRLENADIALILCANDVDNDKKELLSGIRQTQRYLEENFDISITVSFSRFSTDRKELHQLYENAKKFARYHIVYAGGVILGEEECRRNIQNQETMYPQEYNYKLEEALNLDDKQRMFDLLDDVKKRIAKLSYENILISTMSLVTSVNTAVNKNNVMKEYPMSIDFSKIYSVAVNMKHLDELFLTLKEFIESIMSNTYADKEKGKGSDQLFVETIVRYVGEQYSDPNLSSNNIASYMGMSNQYLMKKFKKRTGYFLSEYIMQVRMQEAAHLLTSTNMSINSIAESVGIENESYFYKLFRKVFGCTPREFSPDNR